MLGMVRKSWVVPTEGKTRILWHTLVRQPVESRRNSIDTGKQNGTEGQRQFMSSNIAGFIKVMHSLDSEEYRHICRYQPSCCRDPK